MADGYADGMGWQGTKEIIVRSIVTEGHDHGGITNFVVRTFRDEALAGAPHADFDDLLPLQHFDGLIAQEVTEQQAKFVSLANPEITCGGTVVPRHGCCLQLDARSRGARSKLVEDRFYAQHPVRYQRQRGLPSVGRMTT